MNIVAVENGLCKGARARLGWSRTERALPWGRRARCGCLCVGWCACFQSPSVAATRVGSRLAMRTSPLASRANGFSRGFERFELLDLVG